MAKRLLSRRQERIIIRKVELRKRLTNKALAHEFNCSTSLIRKTAGPARRERDRIHPPPDTQIDAFPTDRRDP